LAEPNKNDPSRRLREASGVLVLALAVIALAALVSYDPGDPSLLTSTERANPNNWAGRVGASLAELSLQLFGLGAFLLPLGTGLVGFRLFRAEKAEAWPTRLVGIALGVAGLCGLLSLGRGGSAVSISYPFGGPHEIVRGGLIGEYLVRPLHAVLGNFGSVVGLVALTGLAFLLATSLSIAEIAGSARRRTAEVLLALVRRWTHLRERKEKQAMKLEVVRKHLERSAAEEELRERAERGEGAETIAIAAPLRVVAVLGTRKPFLLRRLSGHQPSPPSPRPTPSFAPGIPALAPARPAPPPPPVSVPKLASAVGLAPEPRILRPEPPSTSSPMRTPLPQPAPRIAVPERGRPLMKRPVVPAPQQEVIPEVAATLTDYTFPQTSLLDRPPAEPTELDRRALFDIGTLIAQKCSEFKVDGEIEEIQPGPVVTTYEFKPAIGVKYNRIVNLADDLALALKAEAVRIERVPGRSTVGIEVPNAAAEMISLRELFESEKFVRSSSLLTLGLGKDIHGGAVITDLTKMPHLLIAGATGAGKSVGINTIITSILFKARPKEVKFILIDPKMVELKPYEDLPHLACPIVIDPKKAANALKWAVSEMEERYRTLADCWRAVRNIEQYNAVIRDPSALEELREKNGGTLPPKPEPMPYIVIVIDELADLMMTAPKDIEEAIARLAQMARAVGIHLVVATQRPSVDVITGVIKANFPSRIAFKVASKIDSRTILDGNGAEKLLGRGDMLFLPPGTSRLLRIHGAYISEKETASVVKFLKKQGEPRYDEEILRDRGGEEAKGFDDLGDDEDSMYNEAARLVVTSGQASASYLQRKLKLGYARAARILDMMERDGIVGPGQGAKPREILVPSNYFDEVDHRE
jgi:S-DNA-T family DNA segregation ATPase FtsK/SpoIIIE